MSKKLLFLISISLFSTVLFAQNPEGAISMAPNKHAVAHLVDYGTGFHTIFYDETELKYYRLGYDFSIEKEGSASLSKLGYKPKIIEINGNRKEIFVYYRRIDSAGIWLFTINTISGKSAKSITELALDKFQKVIGNYSIGDTMVVYAAKKGEQPKLQVAKGGKLIWQSTLSLNERAIDHWFNYVSQYGQLSKTLVHRTQLSHENFMHVGAIKHYYNHRKISVCIDKNYTSTLSRFDKTLGKNTTYTAYLDLEMVGIPSGGMSGSILRGKQLYQAGLFKNGALVQKTDLNFEKKVYTQFFPYGYSSGTGSPTFMLNRGDLGTFEEEKVNNINLHFDRPVRFFGMNVTTKGPFEHFSLAEMEPVKHRPDWVYNENAISPKVARRRKQGFFTFYSLQAQSSAHYAFLHHIQGMSNIFCATVSNKGDKNPYLGTTNLPLAKASDYYYKYTLRGKIALQPTVAKLNGLLYYCYFDKRERKFIFTSI